MKKIKFSKMNGQGNDFIIIDTISGPLELSEEQIIMMCDRHFGIGADGLIMVKRSEIADFKMDYYNSDGSIAEMCGNGIRCMGSFLRENKLSGLEKINIETLAGVKEVTIKSISGRDISLKVNMGKPEFNPKNIPVDIEYEDEVLLVVNKKAGMVVHPSFGHYEGTLINALTYYLKDLPLFSSGEMRPGLVHRLDKNTSGLIVIAKTEIALNKLAKQFFNKSVEKKYIALVWGNIEEEQGTITGHIGRSLRNRKIMHVFTDGSYGKNAITHYKVLERLGYVNLVECKPETGRTHQIRVHFQHIKHPLFNDESYGGDRILRGNTFTKYKQFVQNCFKLLPRHALHAKSLGFIHPASDKYISFDSELPDDMKQTIDKWRNYSIDY